MKGKRVNPPHKPYFQRIPSQVIFIQPLASEIPVSDYRNGQSNEADSPSELTRILHTFSTAKLEQLHKERGNIFRETTGYHITLKIGHKWEINSLSPHPLLS